MIDFPRHVLVFYTAPKCFSRILRFSLLAKKSRNLSVVSPIINTCSQLIIRLSFISSGRYSEQWAALRSSQVRPTPAAHIEDIREFKKRQRQRQRYKSKI